MLKFLILSAGKPALKYARLGLEQYRGRLEHYGKVDWQMVKAGGSEEVSGRLLERSQGLRRIALDERGELLSTEQWARAFARWEADPGVGQVAFLIGAADGHSVALREAADEVWSLSPLTLQHELALLVLAEQLYRVMSYRRGEPYHRP